MTEKETKIFKSTCRMCHGVCGVLLHVRGGRVVRIEGDRGSPTNRGYLCSKGQAAIELLYHPDRLTHPLRRIGARGENRWERIGWEEALEAIAERLDRVRREDGPQAFAIGQGTGRPYTLFNLRFANAFGTPNFVAPGELCYLPRVIASHLTCGQLPVCDYYGFGGTSPALVLVWGCNTIRSHADGMCGHQLLRVRRQGAKLVVVDPRRTELAVMADRWVQVRPGSDAALALGMMAVILEEELYDREFVERWTVGFDQLKEHVRDYTPEKVEGLTWVPAGTIREVARLYATTKPAALHWGVGIDQNVGGFQAARALLILRGITGNLDIPGGDVFWVPPADIVQTSPFVSPEIVLPDRLPPAMAARRLGADRYKLSSFAHPRLFCEAVLTSKPYPIKAFLLMGSNPLLTWSNPRQLEAALRRIDFFAAVDLFMTPTAQLADIVLPAASWLEQDDIADLHFVWCVRVRQKVASIGECRDDKQILIDLARRLGLGDSFPWRDVREYCDWVLRPAGLDFERFKEMGILQGAMRYRKYEQEGFKTPSGKFEIVCAALEALGHEPLPVHKEPPESPFSTPELSQEYPLILITGGRVGELFCSEGRQIDLLRRCHPDPLLEIHPQTAQGLGIAPGDWVWIETLRGKIRQRARLTEGIDPRVVHAEYGWWFPEKAPPEYGWQESNVNLLIDNHSPDPIFGTESMRGLLCKVCRT